MEIHGLGRDRVVPLQGVEQIESSNYRVGKETFSLRIKVLFGVGGEEGECAGISLHGQSSCSTSYTVYI